MSDSFCLYRGEVKFTVQEIVFGLFGAAKLVRNY